MPRSQIRGGDDLELGEDDPNHTDDVAYHDGQAANPEADWGTLRVTLLRAEDLIAMDKNGLSDP